MKNLSSTAATSSLTVIAPIVVIIAALAVVLLVVLGVLLDRRRRERRWKRITERRTRLLALPPATDPAVPSEGAPVAALRAGLVETVGTVEGFPVVVADTTLALPAPTATTARNTADPVSVPDLPVPALGSVHEMYAHRVRSAATTLAHKGQTTQSLS